MFQTTKGNPPRCLLRTHWSAYCLYQLELVSPFEPETQELQSQEEAVRLVFGVGLKNQPMIKLKSRSTG